MKKHTRVVLFPYKMSSQGCKSVAAQLTTMDVDCVRVYADRDYSPKSTDLIVFWGSGHEPLWIAAARKVGAEILNPSENICLSVNKLAAFQRFKVEKVPTPEWTQSYSQAVVWSKTGWVCCRQSLEGMDGAGLVLAKKVDELVDARLYTQFIKNQREFRVYVFDDAVIDVLEKHPDDEATEQFIRTEANHYIYTRPNLNTIPHITAVQNASRKAAKALGLTFAGVDVILGDDGCPYVLETNTAPGIGQITARRIANAIKEYAKL